MSDRPQVVASVTGPANLVPVDELPALLGRSSVITNAWVENGGLPSVTRNGERFVRRADIEALLAPARRLSAAHDERVASGQPAFTPEQLALVTRVLNESLATLAAKRVPR